MEGIKVKMIIVIIFIILVSSLIAFVLIKDEDVTQIEDGSSFNEIQEDVSGAIYTESKEENGLANPRIIIENSSGTEVIGLDHEGTGTFKGNISATNTGAGYGFFRWIGSSVTKIVKGWFTNLQVDDTINASIINATGSFYEGGSRIALNSSLSDYVLRADWTTIDDYPTGCLAGEAVRIIGDTLTCISFTDTNETSFVTNLSDVDCPSGQLVIGVQANGTVLCATDTGGTNYYPTNVNLTAGTYNGSLINGSDTGYSAGDAICNDEFSGHFCNEFEISLWYQVSGQGGAIDNEDAWIIAGSPKYVPANIPVNDCNGFTHGTAGTYLGNYWHFENTTGGDGRAINCGTTLKLACCVY